MGKIRMDHKLQSFLSLIAFSEGTSTSPITKNNGYDIVVSGVDGPSIFTDYSDHPFARGGSVTVRRVPLLVSTAAGRYQVLAKYFEVYKDRLGLPDFSPASQDAVAVQQMKERGAIDLIESGDVEGSITACAGIWASFPGNSYAQGGGRSMDTLVSKYKDLLEV
jgi:muramidase (phage lysozyme)